jgi:hypothetical protein
MGVPRPPIFAAKGTASVKALRSARLSPAARSKGASNAIIMAVVAVLLIHMLNVAVTATSPASTA